MTDACCSAARASGPGSGERDPGGHDLGGHDSGRSDLAPHAASAAGSVGLAHAWVDLPGGVFRMGSEDADCNRGDGEGPVREVEVAPFAISAHAVTSTQFAAFVEDSGYATDAERFGWSFVFAGFLPAALRKVSPRAPGTPWWCAVQGASWRAPEGPGSDLAERADHPAVHVSWADAAAYCDWAGVRLPTEVEWEYAARGGLDQARFPWGDELVPDGEFRCNTWQGRFPVRNTAEDGWAGTCPVDAFPPNGFGLFNTSGNVWEWCADDWSVEGRAAADGAKVMRGGSYLCHESYCNRYRVAARTSNPVDSGSGNNGFRVVRG